MDEARNMALLFFVDHLMLKGGQRTIHDLSCQFGARGFTEEMRQAVGTTQEGLTEFLAQFPSLFILDGDQIVLKGFGEVEGKNHLMHIPATGRQRDYAAEAVQFFVQKLEKFGPELQIKSLLGHRSQAAPEVRLVSGRHLKEFADFLASQTEHFIVEGDRVQLKNMPEPKARCDEYLDEEGRPLAGHRAKLAAIEYMKEVLEQNEEQSIPLDQFYRKFCERFPHHFRQEVATNPKELLMFLKLNRHIFFIRSNKVQLVRNRLAGEEFGSESGRSTEDATGSERSATSPEENGKNNNNDHEQSAMFPLNRENLGRVQLAKTLRQAQESIRALKADLDSDSSAVPFIAVDFKIVSLGTHQHLEQFIALIVVCCPAGERIVVFDLAHCEGILTESGLVELFEADRILKVTHDVRIVAPLLANRYGIKLHNVFDTQIAHSVIQHHKFGKPMGELRAISFVNLQRVYYPQSLVLSDVSPRKLSQTPNWADRPISSDLLLSACEECHCLANGLFRLLHLQMLQQHRSLFEQLSAEALQMPQQNEREMTRNGNNNSWNGLANGNRGMIIPSAAERRVKPLLELPMNGIYRPPAGRHRGSCQNPQQQQSPINGQHCPFPQGGYVPPPLRKFSAPPSQQLPLMGQRRQQSQFVANRPEMREMGTQTISTGEIAVLKVYYDETEEQSVAGDGQQQHLVTKKAVMNGKSNKREEGIGLSNGTE